jgi:RNA polymerase sigma-70 factor (ECF subfamily)
MTDEDSELVLLSKKGRMEAFRKLVEKYKRPAYFIALGLVGNRDDAYDLSQEAFIRVYRNLPRFDPRHRFFSWFYAILSNLCKNHLRGRQVREQYVSDRRNRADCDRQEETAPGPDVLLEQNEASRRLWQEIERLPFEFREIIVLKHFQGLSYKEISAMLGIPIGTVMSRLYHARKKLKDNLQSNDGMRVYEV